MAGKEEPVSFYAHYASMYLIILNGMAHPYKTQATCVVPLSMAGILLVQVKALTVMVLPSRSVWLKVEMA